MMQDKTFSFPADVRFHHSRLELDDENLNPRGGSTIAYYIDHDNNRLVGALAICSTKDLFSKEIGRAYSLERLTRRMNEKSVRDASDMPLAVVFDIDDLNRWVSTEVNKQVEKFYQAACNGIYKNLDITIPHIDMQRANIGQFQVGFLINRLSNYFATYHFGD